MARTRGPQQREAENRLPGYALSFVLKMEKKQRTGCPTKLSSWDEVVAMCQHAAIIVCFVFSSLRRSVVLTVGACGLTHPAGTMLNLRPAPGRTRFKTPNLGLIVKTVEYRVLGDCLQLLRSCLEAWVKGHLRPHHVPCE